MPNITVLPHEEICPGGTSFEAKAGTRLSDALAQHGVEIEHACEKSCVCTTCHVIVRRGFDKLRPATDDEEDQLGRAWGLEAQSRLSCQVTIAQADLEIEIPRYTLNFAREGH
ncbi:MAG: ISC system 2Fe-2S type ferredoxin [Gammaproteobacteria bacterium]